MGTAVLIGIVALSIALMLLRPGGIAEAWWIGAGAGLLVTCRLVAPADAGRAVLQGGDVYLFLIGMMLLSELAREQGVFDWVAAAAVRHAGGSSIRLFSLIYLAGIAVTVFMSNDATAIVLTPAVLAAVRKAEADPLPHLFACALIANAASFVLPISNPANLVVYRFGMPQLGLWMRAFALASVLSIAATYLVLRWLFRRPLAAPCRGRAPADLLTGSGKLVLAGLAAMIAVLLTASAFKRDLGLPTCLCALAVVAAVALRRRRVPWRLLGRISWSTLALVAGLFVMVNAVERVGALRLTEAGLDWAQRLSPALGAGLVGFVVGVANNLVNNLPLGLLAGGTVQAAHANGLMAHVVLVAVDLGPNLSVTGSLATLLWLIALRNHGVTVGFGRFLKVGCIAMPVALLLALAGILCTGRLP